VICIHIAGKHPCNCVSASFVPGFEGSASPAEQLHNRAGVPRQRCAADGGRAGWTRARGAETPAQNLTVHCRPVSLRPAAFIPRKFRIVPAELLLKSRTYRIYPNRCYRRTKSDFSLAVRHAVSLPGCHETQQISKNCGSFPISNSVHLHWLYGSQRGSP